MQRQARVARRSRRAKTSEAFCFLPHPVPPTTLKKFECKRPKDGAGNAYAALKALTENSNSHAKEDKGASHEKLVNTRMKLGQNPDDLFFALDECLRLLKDIE